MRVRSRLVLAAAVAEQLLVVHPAATVSRLLVGHYRELTGTGPWPPRTARIAAARRALAQLGVTVADLHAAADRASCSATTLAGTAPGLVDTRG